MYNEVPKNCGHCSTVPGEKPSSQKEFGYCGKRKKADLSKDKSHSIFYNTFLFLQGIHINIPDRN